MGDDAAKLGNVVLSRPFQLTEMQAVGVSMLGRRIVWIPKPAADPTPIINRWVYAFEVGERDGDQKPVLAAEYHADEHGKLGFVAGGKRRLVDATKDSPPVPAPVADAALPVVRQGKRLRHVFVATRGRMGKDAIWDMENGLDPLFTRVDLADVDSFVTSPRDAHGPVFVPVVDPLTLGEYLGRRYHEALNEAINYTVVHEHNPHNDEVAVRSRKYQLATMIKDTLLAPDGEMTDPLGVRPYMQGGGQVMLNFMEEHESKVRKLSWQSRNAAAALVRMLDSAVWLAAYRWYMGTEKAQQTVGHFWLDATFHRLDRLGETEEGRALMRRLIDDRANGLLSYLLPPEEDEGAAMEAFKRRFAVARKAATGVVVALAETAPALMVFAKIKSARKLILKAMHVHLARSEVTLVTRTPDGRVARMLKVSRQSVHVELDYKEAKLELKDWLEDGKPHWPPGSRIAEAADRLGRLFILVESLNFFFVMEDVREGKAKPIEGLGALLDLTVAAEDPIRALATKLSNEHRALKAMPAAVEEGLHAEAGAAAREVVNEAAEKEAKSLLERVLAPAAFKFLGAASAAIDFFVNLNEAREAKEKGDENVSLARWASTVGSGILALASVANAAGYIADLAVVTAASSVLLIVGLVFVVAGAAMIFLWGTSPWQKFVRHSVFGDAPAHSGREAWSGGNFSAWTETRTGLDKQIEVLTSMLCAFTVSGTGFDAQTIAVTFGAVPPGASLHVQFKIEYENGTQRDPRFTVDLGTLRTHSIDDGVGLARFEPYQENGQLRSMILTAGRPRSLEKISVRRSSCTIAIDYGQGEKNSVANGKIPIAGPMEYSIFEGGGLGAINQISSLEYENPNHSE